MSSDMKGTSQINRFIEAAREAGCEDDEAAFIAKLRQVAKPPPKSRRAYATLNEAEDFFRRGGLDQGWAEESEEASQALEAALAYCRREDT